MVRNVQRLVRWLLLAVVSVLLVVLAARHRSLRDAFFGHRRADLRLQAASYVSAFAGVSVGGDSMTVDAAPAEGRQVLNFLTSTCPFCRQTLPSWTELAGRLAALPATAPRVQVVALATDSNGRGRAVRLVQQPDVALVPFPSRKHAALYRGFSVPQTVVVDSDGRVLFARNGVIDTPAVLDSAVAAVRQPLPARTDGVVGAKSGSDVVPSMDSVAWRAP